MSLVAGFVRIFAKNWWLGLIVLVLLYLWFQARKRREARKQNGAGQP